MTGRSQNPSPSTHTETAHPSQEWRGTSRARTQTRLPQHPSQEWRAQPKPEPKHAHPSQELRVTSRARKQTRTPQHSSKERRGPTKPRAQAHTQTPQTPARSGGVRAERAHKHTQNPNTPARSGGAETKPEPKHAHPHRTPQPGVAGNKRSAHTSTHRPQHPSQEWRDAAETRAQAYTPTANNPARSGWAQPKPEPKHTRPHRTAKPGDADCKRSAHTNTHTPTTQPGVAGGSRNPSPSTHTHAAHPSQELRGTSGARAQTHTNPNSRARSGGAQPKPEPKHRHTHRTPQPGMVGYKRGARTQTRTPQRPSHERRGAAKSRAQAHTPTTHTRARKGVVREKSAHKHTHTPTTQPEVAGSSQNPSPSTHTHTTQPSQEWLGTSGARTQAHKQPNNPARSGGTQPKTKPEHTHAPGTPKPGVAGYKQSGHTSTHRPQRPSQKWQSAAETRAQAHAPTPHSPARSGGVQAERARKHTYIPSPQP